MMDDFTLKIAKILGEENLEGIELVVKVAGEERSAKYAKKAAQLYQGGLMTADGSRRRTKGGCFFFAAKMRMSKKERREAGLQFKREKNGKG